MLVKQFLLSNISFELEAHSKLPVTTKTKARAKYLFDSYKQSYLLHLNLNATNLPFFGKYVTCAMQDEN